MESLARVSPMRDPRDRYGSDVPIMTPQHVLASLAEEQRRLHTQAFDVVWHLIADYGAEQVLAWVHRAIALQQGAPDR
jgi:hypothetical protein